MVKKTTSSKTGAGTRSKSEPVVVMPSSSSPAKSAASGPLPVTGAVSGALASLVEEVKQSAKTAPTKPEAVAGSVAAVSAGTAAVVTRHVIAPVPEAPTQPNTPIEAPATPAERPVVVPVEVSATPAERPVVVPVEVSATPAERPVVAPPVEVSATPAELPAVAPVEASAETTGLPPEPESQHVHAEPVYTAPPLYIVHITPELAPVAKVGGLADVVFGLANEMEIRGNSVEVILPKYDCLRYDHIWGLCETYSDLWVPWYGGAVHCTVFFGFVHGRKCFFIEPHSGDNFFNRGCIYGFRDDVMRFAFFSRAAMEFLLKSGKNPAIIHCHDWQTALVPVFLFEIYKYLGMTHPRVCFTIHNFKHQGVTGGQVLQATGLNRPDYYAHYDRLRDNHNPHAINLMKGGVVYSNFVTTVSPRHAHEAKDQDQGFGLEPTLHIHHVKFGGVVNGIDYNVWNPEIDGHIPVHYTVESLDGKYANKRALRERLMIADNEKPIVAFVGRLDPQKGLELLRHAIYYTLQQRGQFILLGSSPDGQINNFFWGLKHQLNDNPDVHIEIGFNEELSHLIYAGADIMLVPSRFEPCGLTQLIAMKYGAIPVVREVGGLADTVYDKDFSHRPLHERNGYLFRDYDHAGLESALGRALSCYYDYPEHFRELIRNAMRHDFSWKNPGQDYLNIYDYIREK